MTKTKTVRVRRSHGGQSDQVDDLAELDPDSPFTKKVRELRAYMKTLGKPLEEWSEADRVAFRVLSESNSLAVALAISTPGGTTASAENPHLDFSHNDS